MPREQDLLKAFIEFADTIVDEYDVVEFLHRLAERCVGILDASEAGISLADALVLIRAYAFSRDRPISAVAADVGAGHLRFD